MDNNFAEFMTTAGWNTPTHILERRLILSVVKVLCTGCTPSLHPHCTHKVENAKGKGCTCTRCPVVPASLVPADLRSDIIYIWTGYAKINCTYSTLHFLQLFLVRSNECKYIFTQLFPSRRFFNCT
jgi:hypothetical protein